MSNLLTSSKVYKPFNYPWAYEAFLKQNQMLWLPEEVSLADDIHDWNHNLTQKEKNLITQIFRFFTTADVEVSDNYMTRYMQVFKPTEIQMMLGAFANMEGIHIAAYSYLLDTIGMPETEYSAFLQYKAMKDKVDYMDSMSVHDKESIARTLAVFGAFTEGVQLFASFAILFNFARHGKMNGMGQIVTWSVRDEDWHCRNVIKLFRTFIEENPELWVDSFKKTLYDAARKMIELEDAFIDLAFEQGGVEGLTADEVKQYIRYIADRRLLQLGLKTEFKVKKNPLPWMEDVLNLPEHMNFFEGRVTEYQKNAIVGDFF